MQFLSRNRQRFRLHRFALILKLADQVLERLREPMPFLARGFKGANRLCCPHFLLEFIAQKSASSINF
jgi:hypothetical protein